MNREMQYSLLWNKQDTNIDIGINNICIQLYIQRINNIFNLEC